MEIWLSIDNKAEQHQLPVLPPEFEVFSNNMNTVVNINEIGEINLTGKEFDLFYALITNPGKIFTREELLELVWGYAYYGDLRTVDVHIRRIREKIEADTKDAQYIMTKWGEGYYFTGNTYL